MLGEDVIHFDSNDPNAMEQFVECYREVAEKFCFQYGVTPKEISAVVQDIFIKIDQKIKRKEMGSLGLWFYQVVIRTVREHERKQKKARKLGNSNAEPFSYGYYLEKHGHITIQETLAKLDRKSKLPLILHYYHDKNLDEISTILKVNDETVTKRIQQGMAQLSENYEKANTTKPYLVDKFDDVFQDLNYAYQLLPEFTDTANIMTSLEHSRKKNQWKKYMTPIGAVVGLVVFAVFGLNYMQEQKVAINASKEMEESTEETDPVDEERNKRMEEYHLEIAKYLEEAIENFEKELGLDNLSYFPKVAEVQTIINDLKENPEDFRDNESYMMKDYIDMMFTPPSVHLRNLEFSQDLDAFAFMETLSTLNWYQNDFQIYLDSIITDIPVDEYVEIYELQDKPEDYKGSKDISNLLRVLDEQGYKLINDNGKLRIRIDVDWIKSELNRKGFDEGYLAYLDFYMRGLDFEWSSWKEHKEYMLEAEQLLMTYRESYSKDMREQIYNEIHNYLQGYLRIWDGYSVSEEEREEYISFVNNHPDSKVTQIIQSYLNEWEANDWKREEENYAYPDTLGVYFELGNVKYEEIYIVNRWPFVAGIGEIYKDYSNNMDITTLSNLNPVEIVSLFSYASKKEEHKIYSTLIVEPDDELNEFDWFQLRDTALYAVAEYEDSNTANVIFTDWDLNYLLTIELIKQNGIWKIK